jgi:hypothetical protein
MERGNCQLGVERVLYGSDAATNPLAYTKAGSAAGIPAIAAGEPEIEELANS